jgi:hypothetical protein
LIALAGEKGSLLACIRGKVGKLCYYIAMEFRDLSSVENVQHSEILSKKV